MLDEEPAGAPVVLGSIGDPAGSPNSVIGSIMTDMARTAPNLIPPVVTPKPAPAQAAVETPPVTPRLPEGGRVQLGQLLRKVPPQYPAIARAARVSGDIVLECVVGVDGRIVEVKVKSGNPMLVRAAVDAVWQWLYEPSRLNGTLIEIITNITVSFKLN
jgi:protein TonB